MEVNGTIECQHGPEECYGNVVQACLLFANGGDAKQSLTFITCMIEQPNSDDTHSAAKKCADDLKLDWSSLSACANGPQGAKLIAANKAKTDALNPAHQYVPWILINGVHTEDLENKCLANLLGYLCKNYLPKNQPECKQADLGLSMPAENLYKNKINVELIPSGNTNVMANGRITCQHGPSECIGNAIQACNTNVMANGQIKCQHGPSECFGNAIQACLFARDQNTMQSLQFMVCMYNDHSKNIADKAKNCVENMNLRGWDGLYDCANGPN
ncbi:PREDICTED: uncharacterized protein LOC108380108, partial [Rhagoletis zephyria]|uniref:uncharacterized protein LOC108380108 n=1 Tax=Rhagoletis zephyria TaxID=28612 RepID=UPI0008115814